jgi:hypothetical protein
VEVNARPQVTLRGRTSSENAFTRADVVGKLLIEEEDEMQSGDWTSFWEVALGWTEYVSCEADTFLLHG